MDREIKEEDYADQAGATACVVFLTKEKIFCANAGDSRAVLAKGESAPFEVVELSEDHKPQNPIELARIRKSGHFVEDDRVDGNLALSRAIGDYQYKQKMTLTPQEQAVTAYPDIKEVPRSEVDQFLIVACDGIWDCLSNEDCIKRLNDYMIELKPKEATSNNYCGPVEKMLDSICAVSSDDGIGTDNMTAILVKFNNK